MANIIDISGKQFGAFTIIENTNKKDQLSLSERTYECDCGFSMDRDVKSAICIEAKGLRQIPMDHRNFKEQEISSSTFFNLLTNIGGVEVSKVES